MTIRVAESRTVPVALEAAYAGTRRSRCPRSSSTATSRCRRSSGWRARTASGPARSARRRTIHTSDGGSLHETLSELEPPHRFGYRIDQVRGPMRPLVRHLDGEWAFAAEGAGTTITWSWSSPPPHR